MKLGSLFDGAGTCPLAGSVCGVKPVWASEIEPFPVSVSSSNFPQMDHLGDITQVHGDKIEAVDIITFGSPCQDLSVAGPRKGLDGERSGLFMEAVRIIKEMRCATHGRYPEIVIWENVPGAFSSNKGEDFRTVLEELCRICNPEVNVPRPPLRGGKSKWGTSGEIMGDGFSLSWRTLDAKFWGVPQRRRRIFLVLDLGGQCAGEILFKREGLQRDFKTVRRERKAAARATEGGFGETSGAVPYTLKVRCGCNGGGQGSFDPDGSVCNPGDEQRPIPVPTTQLPSCLRLQSGTVPGSRDRMGAKCGNDPGSQDVRDGANNMRSETEPSDLCDSRKPDRQVSQYERDGDNGGCCIHADDDRQTRGCFPIENHPQDCRVKLSEDGMVQTLPARMGTGGGTRPSFSSPLPAGTVRELCKRPCGSYAGDASNLPISKSGSCAKSYLRVKFWDFREDPIAGTLRVQDDHDPTTFILQKGGTPE